MAFIGICAVLVSFHVTPHDQDRPQRDRADAEVGVGSPGASACARRDPAGRLWRTVDRGDTRPVVAPVHRRHRRDRPGFPPPQRRGRRAAAARSHRRGRRALRLRQRWRSRSVRRPERPGSHDDARAVIVTAALASLSQRPRPRESADSADRCHRAQRHHRHRLRHGRRDGRHRQRRLDRPVRDEPGFEPDVSQQWRRHVRRRHGVIGYRRSALEHERHVLRLRPRRLAGPVRGQLR